MVDSNAKADSSLQGGTVISILGATATGKTATAFSFIDALRRLNSYQFVRVISVDSRQVYRDIPIISGIDIPRQYQHQSHVTPPYFYQQSEDFLAEMHGVQIISADAPWSLADFQNYALPLIYDTWTKQGLVILVGGTGLYHQRLFSSQLRQHPGPDITLRKKMKHLPLAQLQKKAETADFESFKTMTHSDKQNKRRLVRLIEKASDHSQLKINKNNSTVVQPKKYVRIVLDADRSEISTSIEKRVLLRIKQGAREEVSRLLKRYSDHSLPIFSATGVREVVAWINEEIDQKTCQSLWTIRERQYAKRQQTWFSKFASDATWFTSDLKNQNKNKLEAVNFLIDALA